MGPLGNPKHESLLEGSWDLVTTVIIKVTILISPIKVLITLLSHDPPSRPQNDAFESGPALKNFGAETAKTAGFLDAQP